MIRKTAVVGTVVGLAVCGLAPAAWPVAGPTITATGDVTCSGTGRIKATTSGFAGGATVRGIVKVKMRCQGSTGNAAVTIKGAKVRGELYASGRCKPDGNWFLNITWKAKGGRINPTRASFATSKVTPTGWSVPRDRESRAGGFVTGSYAGMNSASGVITGPAAAYETACGGTPPQKHLDSITLTMSL